MSGTVIGDIGEENSQINRPAALNFTGTTSSMMQIKTLTMERKAKLATTSQAPPQISSDLHNGKSEKRQVTPRATTQRIDENQLLQPLLT
jgi:hypothetical protein